MKEQFISWLESEKPKSVRHYTSGYNTIEKILSDNNFPSLKTWSLENFESELDYLKSFETFETLNASGNNTLTATLSNFKKFMKQKDNINTPVLPFDSFGWRWASTGIASHLNNPKSLKIILDALLINGNGQDNYTKDFKNLVHKLCLNKYNISEEESDKLTKLSNLKDEKNIIENSANYWFHLGLIDSTGKNTTVSALGEKFLNGLLSNDEFVTNRIDEYFLPNKAYKNTEINKWESVNLKIYPLKLIQDIFYHLFENYEKEQQYITESELSNIVIPCSYNIDKFDTENITNHIIEFRKEPNKYSSWPKPQSNYTDDKGLRMSNEFLYFLEVFGFLSSNKGSIVKSTDKKYMATSKFINMNESENEIKTTSLLKMKLSDFKIKQFKSATEKSGLTYSTELITRYISSLITKPFVLLSGLSGSGKTKLAQAFAQWICEDDTQYSIVPVGADWTNREPLLGYVNALNNTEYILPENGALDLIIQANKDQDKPYFLILDEMNLSHVERYFADFLSVMESKDKFKLHSDKENEKSGVPHELSWPKNLFVVGTVNIDETTYMFSPKVLDRANVIEFKVNETEIKDFLNVNKEITSIKKMGASMGNSFVTIAKNNKNEGDFNNLNIELLDFFAALQKLGAEFGYRTASEIQTLFSKIDLVNPGYSTKENEKIDIAIMQKLLPKLHGSRRKLLKTLSLLAQKCLEKEQETIFNERGVYTIAEGNTIKYNLSFEKIARMYKNAIENGFASYAEA
jgi:energy-coupling factor transporter ATP-binding protein EcfA2